MKEDDFDEEDLEETRIRWLTDPFGVETHIGLEVERGYSKGISNHF